MKKIIKIFAALVICTSVVMFSSCKEDPVDKQLDKMEALLNKFDKLATDDNPTPKELMSFQNLKSSMNNMCSNMKWFVLFNTKII
jgi:hypothetical protein